LGVDSSTLKFVYKNR